MASLQNFPSGHGFKAWLVDVGFVVDRSSTGSGFLGVLCFPWMFHYFFFSFLISIMNTFCSITLTFDAAFEPIFDSMYWMTVGVPLEEGARQSCRDTRHFIHIIIFLMRSEWVVGIVSISAKLTQYDTIPWIGLYQGWQPFC
jgi:hypothetical protein